MALRRQDLPQADRLVLLRDVLAEAAGVDPSRTFDGEAGWRARGMRGVRRDWAGRPQVSEATARELLDSLRVEQRQAADHQAAIVAQAEADHGMMVPSGIMQLERPGEPVWTSPNFVGNPNFVPAVSGPGD
jgi:hypothetical protein